MPDDDFDRIVEGLDLDFSFADEPLAVPDEQPVTHPEPAQTDDEPDDEPFYRKVPPAVIVPRTRGRLLAWSAVLAGPLLIVLAAIGGLWLPRVLVAALALTFVAGAIYLIVQLPSHGPSRPDWPDDGAVL